MKTADARKRRRRDPHHERYLWWPLSLSWADHGNWFIWHWIEASRNYPSPPGRHFKTLAQVFHVGRLRIVFGRWR